MNPHPSPVWQATDVFFRNLDSISPTVINIGGARSSKSYSIAQLFVYKFLTEKNKIFLTTRKTFPALRITAYKVAYDLVVDLGIYPRINHNKTEKVFRNPENGNIWFFLSVDDPQKIRSTEFNYVHMEEANEFTYEDFRIIKLRLSGRHAENERNQIFLSLNPSEDQGWIRTKLLAEEPHDLIHSTYKDNPFIPDSYVKELERLKEQDETYWKIYGLGEWASIRELIYGPPTIVAHIPERFDDLLYGLDFGFNNPCALLEIRPNLDARTIHFEELIYQSRLTNTELIDLMKMAISPYNRKYAIYADPEEPARIREIADAGFNIVGAKNRVSDGILFLKRFRHTTTAENVNLIREWGRYKWKKDRNDKILDEPVKFEDHCPDAGRYGIYSHFAEFDNVGAYIGFTKHDVY